MIEERPWGFYKVLEDTETYKVKYIKVMPGQRLSYQKHEHRAEHWTIISGYPSITVDGSNHVLFAGNSIDIPAGTLHRIAATDVPVEFIEIQTGTYFGEDDIQRIEDDYGR
jgi:mannose-6-phosphate isomerase-like protein (cupin superfamily)